MCGGTLNDASRYVRDVKQIATDTNPCDAPCVTLRNRYTVIR